MSAENQKVDLELVPVAEMINEILKRQVARGGGALIVIEEDLKTFDDRNQRKYMYSGGWSSALGMATYAQHDLLNSPVLEGDDDAKPF